MTDEDKQNLDEFMKLQKGEEILKITEFYNEIAFRVPIHKTAEYHSNAGGIHMYINGDILVKMKEWGFIIILKSLICSIILKKLFILGIK